ncbi:MAG: metalloprotease TldD [Shewanellaceae bacterium]|nr:metalloprotease TldD [Shewanellaceae bacterium]
MMIEQVTEALLSENQLAAHDLQAFLNQAHRHQIDFSDLFFQDMHHESFMMEDGLLKSGHFNIDQGVGVRAIAGEKTGFAYADDISAAAITRSVQAASSIANAGKAQSVCVFKRTPVLPYYAAVNPMSSCSKAEQIQLLQHLDQAIRQADTRVVQVTVSLSSSYERMLVCASDGTFAADIRPLTRINCSVVLKEGDRKERGNAGGGGRHGIDEFLQLNADGEKMALCFAHEAIRQAQVALEAQPAPAGEMPVVLGSGWPGVLLHEAVGHGLEGDFNRRGSSAFSGKIGERVAAKGVTVIDDGTVKDRRGSLTVDDEGIPTQRTVLIEDGILKGYMQDKLNARLMGVPSTGNGRRESYAHLPMPRMTNTFMLAGQDDPEEIIASIDKGLYAPNFGGGQVDITSGRFVFSASEAYWVEGGKIKYPVKGATLIGNGPESMSQISMIGNDLALDQGVGVCGKDGQSVPVGVGQPTLKLDKIIVGGTA